jgi:hypothetical protein
MSNLEIIFVISVPFIGVLLGAAYMYFFMFDKKKKHRTDHK